MILARVICLLPGLMLLPSGIGWMISPAETILFATHAIIYPPEAATLSTQAVSLIPASLIL